MPQHENQPLSKIQSIDTTILQEYMQLFLSTHSEHFNLIKSTLTDSERIKQERMLCQAESILSILTCANLTRKYSDYFNKL